MIRLIGDGGHAAVIKDVIRVRFGSVAPIEDYFLVAIGDNRARKRVADEMQGQALWALVHPRAYIADGVELGAGTVVMAGAVIQPRTRIGRHCIVNTCAAVDHGCIVGDFAHIAPGAHLCGAVEVGEGALVGVGVGIAPGFKVPAWHLVKARKIDVVPL